MDCDPPAKTDRMAAVLTRLDDAATPGALVIGAAGMATVLAVLPLSRSAGQRRQGRGLGIAEDGAAGRRLSGGAGALLSTG